MTPCTKSPSSIYATKLGRKSCSRSVENLASPWNDYSQERSSLVWERARVTTAHGLRHKSCSREYCTSSIASNSRCFSSRAHHAEIAPRLRLHIHGFKLP